MVCFKVSSFVLMIFITGTLIGLGFGIVLLLHVALLFNFVTMPYSWFMDFMYENFLIRASSHELLTIYLILEVQYFDWPAVFYGKFFDDYATITC